MFRNAIILLCLSAPSLTAIAQDNGIHVIGFGVVRAEPDIASFNFGIQGQTDTAADAMQRANAISGDLVRRLERLGIAAEDIRSTPVTLSPFIDRQTQRELINFNRTTTATLRELDRFEAVNEAALEAGVNSIGNVSFAVSNMRELQNQARDLALDDARDQAEAIAARLGIGVGRVLSVQLIQQRPGPGPQARASLTVAADSGPDYRTGLFEINQDANVSFEIIQW
jgi:uncharacterized protein YggE